MFDHTQSLVCTEAQILHELRAACVSAGSQAKWARKVGLTPAYVNDVLTERRIVSEAIVNALGFVRRVTYTRIETV